MLFGFYIKPNTKNISFLFQVTQKAFETCGTPKLVSKREAPNEQLEQNFPELNNAGSHNLTLKRNLKKKKSELEKLMADLRKAIKPSQHFWTRMPYAMCTNTASTHLDDTIFFDNSDSEAVFSIPHGALNNDECWNGAEKGSYKAPVVEDGLANQFHNPEVPLKTSPNTDDMGMPNIVKEQIYQLKSITNQLKMAHKGQDVEWWDRELERRDKSTSGSLFEGSGDNVYDGHEDDEDFAVGEGSGAGGYNDDLEDGSGDDDEDMERSSEPTKVNEPWRPWSPEEIEVIEPATTPKSTDSTQKKTSGATSQSVTPIFNIFLSLLLCLLSSYSFQSYL